MATLVAMVAMVVPVVVLAAVMEASQMHTEAVTEVMVQPVHTEAEVLVKALPPERLAKRVQPSMLAVAVAVCLTAVTAAVTAVAERERPTMLTALPEQ